MGEEKAVDVAFLILISLFVPHSILWASCWHEQCVDEEQVEGQGWLSCSGWGSICVALSDQQCSSGFHLGPALPRVLMSNLGAECTIGNFADETKLGGAIGCLKRPDALQRDIGRLTYWTMINEIKVNKSKCRILHLGWSSTRYNYKLGEEKLKSSPVGRKIWGCWPAAAAAQCESAGCSVSAQSTNPILGSVTHSKISWPRDVIILLYSVLVQPQPECWMQCWDSPFEKAVKGLEHSQRRLIKLVMGLERMSCEEQLRTLGLCNLEKMNLSGDFIALDSSLQREGEMEVLSSSAWDSVIELLAIVQSWTRRGSDGIRKHFFTERVVKHWKRLPAEVLVLCYTGS